MDEIKNILLGLQNNISQYNQTNINNIQQLQQLIMPLIDRINTLETEVQLLKSKLPDNIDPNEFKVKPHADDDDMWIMAKQ